MTSIDAALAWEIVRDARDVVWNTDWQPEPGIVISPGGAWTASCRVGPAAAMLFDTLLPVACGATRYVVAQIAQSLDGRIATASGHSRYITGKAGRVHLHRLRALADAVIVGADTVVADDPELTVRHVAGRSPARVIFDPNGRVPHDRKVFGDGGPTTWHAVHRAVAAAPGARPLYLPESRPRNLSQALLDKLAGLGLQRVLVEGGGTTISHFIEVGSVDRLHVVVAPFLIGSGRLALNLPEIEALDAAIRPTWRNYALGSDRLYDLNLRETAG